MDNSLDRLHSDEPPQSDAQAPGSNLPELSVSELANALRRTVEDAYSFVRVRGELGRVVNAKSGHLYFDLKDDKACINAVMWKASAGKLPFRPEEGLEVVAEGRLSTYPQRSNYQMLVDRMRPAGVGALMQLLEERRKKLAAEGLFDPARKRPIPFLPTVIGVVTSPTGAVIRDILHRVRERFPVRVLVWPCLVQGDKAAEQVEAGIRGFNALKPGGAIPRPDVIIVARGGGSIEDLWPFSDERVVRAAAESAIPLISAVGHETDTTLIDHAADLRAPTPTGAAERAVPVRAELVAQVGEMGVRMGRSLSRHAEKRRLQLRSVSGRMPRAEALVQGPRQRLDMAGQRLSGALEKAAARKRQRFSEAGSRLRPAALKREISLKRQEAARLADRLRPAVARVVADAGARLETQRRVLETLSYEGVLKRGFSLVMRHDGSLVRSRSDLAAGDKVRLRFSDGEAAAIAGDQPPAPTGPEAPPSAAAPQRPRVVRRRGADPGPGTDQGNLF